MCSLNEKKHEMMRDWKNIANRSKRITDYLRSLFEEEEGTGEFSGDRMEQQVAERLSRPEYLRQKREEQRRFDADAAFGKLRRRNRRRVMMRVGSVAASVAILLGALWIFGEDPELPVKVASERKVIVPGERKAVLVLNDGRELDLKEVLATKIETVGGIIRIDSAGVICGEETGEVFAEENSYNKLIIPRGGEYHLVLSDGTDVWLNSETELHFPVQFKGDSRQVYLKGEAYFDVKRDSGKPFIVNTAAGDIKVLGTAFAVEVYDTTTMVATLERGSISYLHESQPEVVLRPGEQLTYKEGGNMPRVSKVNTKLYTAWKDHLFCFEEQRLSEIMIVLARWYDLKVRFESEELKNVELSGTLDKYSDVRPLLNLFELGTDVKFEINDNEVIVKKSK